MPVREVDIQQEINRFVDDIILTLKVKKAKNSHTLMNLLFGKAVGTFSRTLKGTKSTYYKKQDYIDAFSNNTSLSKGIKSKHNITCDVITNIPEEISKMYNSPDASPGTIQKYINIIQKYYYCLAHYSGSKLPATAKSIQKIFKVIIDNKELDCPIDNYILKTIFDNYGECCRGKTNIKVYKLNNKKNLYIKKINNIFYNTSLDLTNWYPWSKMNKDMYLYLQEIIKNCLTSTSILPLTGENSIYISDKSIEKGLLFDLIYWTR